MKITSRTKRTSNPSSKDANGYLPETLTDDCVAFLSDLPEKEEKTSYLKKVWRSKFVSQDTDPSDVREQRAINKWLACERENEATNDRLLTLDEDYNILPRLTWQRFRRYVQASIAELLGDTVPLDALLGGFSGGASTTRSRTQSHPALKYLGQAEITSAAKGWFDLVWEDSPLWASFHEDLAIAETKGNIMFTVPKSTTIDRCAAKEPDLNMYLQRGVGNYIRSKLRSVGINLNDQSINQRLARKGSIDGSLATLDLSSASDSVTTSLVEIMLPDLWFGLLRDLRSPYTLVKGEWHENHMFSSMGNGFTFELESLLFWSIAKAVRYFTGSGGVISVYGDDIIVGSGYAEDLSWVLGVLGFSVNNDKSFWTGPFRESCGGHYHKGYDITPFYLKKPLLRVRDAILMANQIRKWSVVPGMAILDPTLEPLWEYLRSFIPRELWGGVDLNAGDQLVSDDLPSRRLFPLSTKVPTGPGGYLLWQDSSKGQTERKEGVQTSSRSIDQNRYALRKVKADGKRNHPWIFLTELHSDPRTPE